MKNPQTLAQNLSRVFPNEKLKSIADYGCCAFCLLWYLDIDCSDTDALVILADMIDTGALDEECTVYWAQSVTHLTGRNLEALERKNIDSIKGVKKAIVRYSNGKKSHWVGVENGEIAFNSLVFSNAVECGKPVEIRIPKISGETTK